MTKLFHTVACFWDVIYPYGEEQNDQEMDVDLVQQGACPQIDNVDGFYLYDVKRYKLFVSLSFS